MDRLSEQVRAAVVAAQDGALAVRDRVELRGVAIAGVPAMTSRVPRPRHGDLALQGSLRSLHSAPGAVMWEIGLTSVGLLILIFAIPELGWNYR